VQSREYFEGWENGGMCLGHFGLTGLSLPNLSMGPRQALLRPVWIKTTLTTTVIYPNPNSAESIFYQFRLRNRSNM
jgi:hypothetical protein